MKDARKKYFQDAKKKYGGGDIFDIEDAQCRVKTYCSVSLDDE